LVLSTAIIINTCLHPTPLAKSHNPHNPHEKILGKTTTSSGRQYRPEKTNRNRNPDRKTIPDQSNLDLKIFIKPCLKNSGQTLIEIFSADSG
jgi:hypothetical protein